MNQTFFLIDNNALSVLRRGRIQSKFFRQYCRVTTDVLREAREHPDYSVLASVEYEVSPAVLAHMRTVMENIDVGDSSLVDLYSNKGMADPGLVAAARDAITAEDGKLFPDEWFIVTNDRAVAAVAAQHNIDSIPAADLAGRIDTATP